MRVNVTKRRKVYQYKFEIAKINGKRKFINKSGFRIFISSAYKGYRISISI